jgi:FkbM family methyltransferase
MPSNKHWRFQARALLTRLGLWNRMECWRLAWRYYRGVAHESDFQFFRHFAGGGHLFVDIGANLGQSALSFRLAQRGASIVSFEPNPDMEPGLVVVKKLLGSTFDYCLHGLGARTEIKRLYVPIVKGIPFPQCATFQCECLTDNPSIRQIFREWTGTDRFEIAERSLQLVRFDDLGLVPDFVKIDVEGGEADVVNGMEKTLKRHRPLLLTEGRGAQARLLEHGYVELIHDASVNTLRTAGLDDRNANVFYLPAERLDELVRLGAVEREVLGARAA